MKIKIEDLLSRKLNVGNRIPLRKWENEWQLPDECKIERYETNLKIHGKEIKIERYRLLGKMGNSSSIKAKKFYKGLSTRGLPYIIENGCVWCILKSNFSPNIIAKASYLSTDGKWLYLKVPEDKIGVWYKNRLNKINFCIIPKEIDLTDEFWEVFGILQGEMTRKSEDIRVSNTNL